MDDTNTQESPRYSLTVTARIKNASFESQLKDYTERSRFNNVIQTPYPEAEIKVKQLEVTLSEDQFAAVKKAVLEVF